MSALAVLRKHYRDRCLGAAAARAAGIPVVGIVGNTVPAELVRAAGCFPLNLSGVSDDTSVGDEFMEPFFEPEIRYIFDGLLKGAFGELALVIVPRTSDQYFKLYLYLREVVRIGKGARVPPVFLYDLLHTRSDRSRRYGLERTRELAERLAQIRGVALTDDAVHAAIVESNRARSAMQAVQALRERTPSALSGVEALAALGAGRFMDVAEYTRTLDAFAVESHTPRTGPRILIKGFPLNHPLLHEAIERLGGNVVAEDDWWGARAAGALIDERGAPLDAIFEKYFRDEPGPRVHSEALRQRWFRERIARGDIDGVVFYVPPFDDLIGWELPADRALLSSGEQRIADVVLRVDAGSPSAQLEEKLRPFLEGLSRARETA
jgi:benzoyl-CoA reductase/2-hydroxyglutaryl-CoA dehydratase subunit BcrC/BadD/HgdB